VDIFQCRSRRQTEALLSEPSAHSVDNSAGGRIGGGAEGARGGEWEGGPIVPERRQPAYNDISPGLMYASFSNKRTAHY